MIEIHSIKSTVYECSILYLKKIENRAGNLTFVESKKQVPFKIRRIFYIYDIPSGKNRGGHAHKRCHQLIVAVSGSFEVLIDDGKNKRIIALNRPDIGLHVPPGIWVSLENFSSGTVCLVLASEPYDEKEYLRDYNEFLNFKKFQDKRGEFHD